MSGPIAKGHYKASGTIQSATTLEEETVTYQAGEEVILKPGFYVPYGTDFYAFIDPMTCEEEGFNFEQPLNARMTNSLLLSVKDINLSVRPNPFFQHTSIDFVLGEAQTIDLAVFSLEGHLVQQLEKGSFAKGYYSVPFEVEAKNGGVFIVMLKTNNGIWAQKIVQIQ